MLPALRNDATWAPLSARAANRMDTVFDRVFGDFFGDGGSPFGQAWAGMPVAMWEDDDHIFIEAELPGVTDKDVDITVHNGMLFIRCERKVEEGRRYLYNGRSYGRLERVITLPEAVNPDEVQARLTDGVLSVALPKSPEARPRKIALRTS